MIKTSNYKNKVILPSNFKNILFRLIFIILMFFLNPLLFSNQNSNHNNISQNNISENHSKKILQTKPNIIKAQIKLDLENIGNANIRYINQDDEIILSKEARDTIFNRAKNKLTKNGEIKLKNALKKTLKANTNLNSKLLANNSKSLAVYLNKHNDLYIYPI